MHSVWKPGATAASAEADLHAIVADLAQRKPDDFLKNWRIQIHTFKETFPSDITGALWILFGASEKPCSARRKILWYYR